MTSSRRSSSGWTATACSRGRSSTSRLLELCDRLGIEAASFVPGHTAETFPEVTAEIAARSHEIANHGYLHEDFSSLSPDGLRAVLRKSNDALERVTGQRPRGIPIPPWAIDAGVFELLLEGASRTTRA